MRLTPLVWLLAISCGTTHELEPLDSASQAGTQP